MKQLLFSPLVAITLAGLTGCVSHLSQQQCATINWHNEGFADAASGRSPRNLSQSIKDCAKYNIPVASANYQAGWLQGARQYCTPDENLGYNDGAAGLAAMDIYNRMPICTQAGIKLKLGAYEAGRQKGLKTFCTYENGLDLARQGKPLANVCPPALRTKFTAGWSAGKEEFCNQAENAFAIGRTNKPYPTLCSPDIYYAFKSEYDRGRLIHQRTEQAQSRADAIDRDITWKASKYSLHKTESGHYELGDNKSPEATEAVRQVNALIREKRRQETELFDLQMMR